MTTVAWDGKTLAADKRACSNSLSRTVTKIRRVGPLLFAGSGDFDFILAMLAWVEGGRDPEKFPTHQRDKDDWQTVLVIEADGRPSIYNRTPHPIRYEDEHIAIGSGRDFALAAMHLGCDAVTAVKVAAALDTGTGNGVDSLEMERP